MATALALESSSARPDIVLQELAESMTQTVMRDGPMARGVLWLDKHDQPQWDFRVYIVLGSKGLTEIIHSSVRDQDTGEFVIVQDYSNRRSITDAWDEVLRTWESQGLLAWWGKPRLRIMVDDCHFFTKIPALVTQDEIFQGLLNGLIVALDRYTLCHPGPVGQRISRLRLKLEEWFPENL